MVSSLDRGSTPRATLTGHAKAWEKYQEAIILHGKSCRVLMQILESWHDAYGAES